GSAARKPPRLSKAPSAELVPLLADDNVWWRTTAQRLLVERQDKSVVPALEKLARDPASALGRLHALGALAGLRSLSDERIESALGDADAAVRRHGLRLAESRLGTSPKLLTAAAKLADDPDPQVRFQAAFSLGAGDSREAAEALARIFRRPDN